MSGPGFLTLLRQAAGRHGDVPPLWRNGPRRSSHDVIVVGSDAFAFMVAWTLAGDAAAGSVGLVSADDVGDRDAAPDLLLHGLTLPPALLPLARDGLSLWRSLPGDLSYDIGLAGQPAAGMAVTEEGRRGARRGLHAARAAGLDVDETAGDALFPGAPVTLVQADAASVQADALVFGLARAAAARGVDICLGRPVSALRVEAGRVRGLETAQGLMAARHVVLTGPQGAALGDWPLRHGARRLLVSEPLTPVLDGALVWPEQGLDVSQAPRGEIVLRGSGPAEAVAARAVEALPRLSRLRVSRWSEQRTVTGRDGAPLIGSLAPTGCFAGFAGGAPVLWPVAARVLADAVMGRVVETVLAPDRLAEGRLLGADPSAGPLAAAG